MAQQPAAVTGAVEGQGGVGAEVLSVPFIRAGFTRKGIPFILTSLGVERFLRFSARFRRYLRGMEIVSGVLLLGIGWLIMTNRLGWLAQYLTFFNRFTW